MTGGSWEKDEGVVEDPDALRRAEQAVAREAGEPPERGAPIDEPWDPVASQVGEALIGGLQDVADSLRAAGVPFGWDPYDPREAPAYLPPLLTAAGRTFMVAVPRSHAADARDVLGSTPPEGVTFAWNDTGWTPLPRGVGSERPPVPWGSVPADAHVPGSAPTLGGDTSRSSVGPGGRVLSDNARLLATARASGPGAGTVIAVLVALLILGSIVAFVLLKG